VAGLFKKAMRFSAPLDSRTLQSFMPSAGMSSGDDSDASGVDGEQEYPCELDDTEAVESYLATFEAPPQGDADLSGYGLRVREMLEELHEASDKTHGLGVLAVKLQALLEDLKSIGADAAVVGPLEKLLRDIQPKAGRAKPKKLIAKVEAVLGAFVAMALAQ
jgi:hypothetical protein